MVIAEAPEASMQDKGSLPLRNLTASGKRELVPGGAGPGELGAGFGTLGPGFACLVYSCSPGKLGEY